MEEPVQYSNHNLRIDTVKCPPCSQLCTRIYCEASTGRGLRGQIQFCSARVFPGAEQQQSREALAAPSLRGAALWNEDVLSSSENGPKSRISSKDITKPRTPQQRTPLLENVPGDDN